jgi:hypothetical protein
MAFFGQGHQFRIGQDLCCRTQQQVKLVRSQDLNLRVPAAPASQNFDSAELSATI